VRAALRSLVLLFVAAAAAAAAFSHYAIDVVADYALAHDTYDDVAHGSRDLLSGIAIVLAAALAVRGLRSCCEIGAARRFRLAGPGLTWRSGLLFVGATAILACAIVPAMELLDAHLAGKVVDDLGDLFGGSVQLGLSLTLFCGALVAAVVFIVAGWLLSHRASIAAAIVSFAARRRGTRPSAQRLRRLRTAPRRRPRHVALHRSKRGPPDVDRSRRSTFLHASFGGDPRALFYFASVASVARDRRNSGLRAARSGGIAVRSNR
jgi:hypothetical protein